MHGPIPSDLSLISRFHALRDLLAAQQALWRPAPFHTPRPAWWSDHPDLAARLLALDDAEVQRLADDDHALIDLVAASLPEVTALHALTDLPQMAAETCTAPARFYSHVPGRKQAQIERFAGGIGRPRHPVLEWCAGKGHLGRLIARRHGVPVTSLEIDAALATDGSCLAERANVAQGFVVADALSEEACEHIAGHHALALHACGDLHIALLRGVVAQGAPALDLAPCCYDRIAAPRYQPLNLDAGLELSREALHLAVTETVTAGARERRQHNTATAWKLAFLELRADLGIPRERTFKPVPTAWLGLDFADWMRCLCAREALPLPASIDWPALQASGWQRLSEVRRLELVRLAFRRPLEVWLALDRAVYLERAGYAVSLSEFCARSLTPRNLLISARLEGR